MLYVNTSVELWDPYENARAGTPQQMTLYWRHMNIRRLVARWRRPGPSAVLEHGANPGLISHFTKQGLIDIGNRVLKDKKVTGRAADEIRQLIADQKFNYLAMKLGVKVIHCSERDTQITNRPKQVDEFVNTWSVEGFREEGTTTAEMGWGTHEKELPPMAYEHTDGPRNQICLALAPRIRYWTSRSRFPADAPFNITSTWYLPAGQPSDFSNVNSVAVGPVGAIVFDDSLTVCPSW